MSDTILVVLTTCDGVSGVGEILPRRYVTGETVEGIMGYEGQECRAENVSASVLGVHFDGQCALEGWVNTHLQKFATEPALFGGVELALWNTLCQVESVDINRLLGAPVSTSRGRCVTVGFDIEQADLRRSAIDARLKGATVMKLKIGLPDDIDRLQQLNTHLKGKLPIRVDANGGYDASRAETLLSECADSTALQSFEEPFAKADSAGLLQQQSLYERFKVPFVADESVCRLSEAREVLDGKTFQVINLRVGRHGGLCATRHIRDLAAQNGLGLVCGSMVGESSVLTQASELLLTHSEEFDYVEGLGQNTDFLLIDPVEAQASSNQASGSMKPLRFKRDECKHLIENRVLFH